MYIYMYFWAEECAMGSRGSAASPKSLRQPLEQPWARWGAALTAARVSTAAFFPNVFTSSFTYVY